MSGAAGGGGANGRKARAGGRHTTDSGDALSHAKGLCQRQATKERESGEAAGGGTTHNASLEGCCCCCYEHGGVR